MDSDDSTYTKEDLDLELQTNLCERMMRLNLMILEKIMKLISELKHVILFPLDMLEEPFQEFFNELFFTTETVKTFAYGDPSYRDDAYACLAFWKKTRRLDDAKYYYVDLVLVKETVFELQVSCFFDPCNECTYVAYIYERS